MWEGHVNFFRLIGFWFFLVGFSFNPSARLFYRKWQSSLLLKENDCIWPKDRLLIMKPVVCIYLPLIPFLRKYNYTRWDILPHPLSLVSPSRSCFGVTDFTPWLQHKGSASPHGRLLAPAYPPLLLLYLTISHRPHAQSGSSQGHWWQEAANRGQNSRSWWALLECWVRCRRASWIVPWLWTSWNASLMSWEGPLWLHQIPVYV